jgi:hypothetical protein
MIVAYQLNTVVGKITGVHGLCLRVGYGLVQLKRVPGTRSVIGHSRLPRFIDNQLGS